MVDLQKWLSQLQYKLRTAFGPRLLFLGLQGSYLRGEAGNQSDIDIMTVLDELHHEDLVLYRSIIQTMPHPELACGFICGREELKNWPRYEITTLRLGTCTLYGSLEPLLPPAGREDLTDHIRISAANLYHAVCHKAIYSGKGAEGLRGCYKSVFFILQELHLLRTDEFIPTRAELEMRLSGDEHELLCRLADWERLAAERKNAPDGWFELLERFCQNVLREVSL